MALTLGRNGGVAQPLRKRTVGQTNIGHVYDGPNHIWPTAVIHFSDFTSVQLRYIWGTDAGRDLDTKSYYKNSPINDLNYVAVGFSWQSGKHPYLYWGGDNVNSGAECVMFNIEEMVKGYEDSMPDEMIMQLCANWYGEKRSGLVTIECTAYKNGVIVLAWQLSNQESDSDTIGEYIFPLADGTIQRPNGSGGYKNCWYGEVVARFNKETTVTEYFRINPVDDTIIGLNDIKLIRNNTFSLICEDGYAWYANRPADKYKIWNNQVNINGSIMALSTPALNIVDDDNYKYSYHTAMLNEDNTLHSFPYLDTYTRRFGFVAGNSEFRGQQTIQCIVPTQGGAAQDRHKIGDIKYTKINKVGELKVYNPLES